MGGTRRTLRTCLGELAPARVTPTLSAVRRQRARLGFSLTELLVVIGLIALLLAFLLPVLSIARTSARKVVCAGRLRELTLACRMYADENGVLPQPTELGEFNAMGAIVVGHRPQYITTTLLNQLRPYLKYPEIDTTTEVAKLPPFVQCPFSEDLDVDRGPTVSLFDSTIATYYTGYAYLARLSERPQMPVSLGTMTSFSTLPVIEPGTMLKPNRSAVAKEKRRAVLWADHVSRSAQSGGFWQYTHARGGRPGPLPLTFKDHAGLIGQHRAFTDASVEWVGAGQPGLEVAKPQPDLTATYKSASEHWWF
jgi:prepilin-type N-terminal cleavage/methylation domain-containing protein